jgi:hypothetical protein
MAKNGGRISDDELERLKASVSLEAVVKAAGIALENAARTWWGAARSTTTRRLRSR